ncbi:uncharacterized protein BXIN_2019 [Babesia sp. Xinjiang]|uniref:uncharacterized protein n=1 Tax=Babesia sp. Xinjiang TaxID=462227 RepID=UPI000A260B04|nr:uncharacterized protein BXIN_2019 [Babesia sp. Xinjiang]ORM40290.1 hypothetical protein BXIN_2019 [Babesia sp. Xinjiang]
MEGIKALPPPRPYKGLPVLCGIMMIVGSCIEISLINAGFYEKRKLISVRLDHLDKRYSAILERYDANHKNIAVKVEQIKTEVMKMEADMGMNTKLTEVYDDLNAQFEAKLAELRTEAQNWINSMIMALELRARQQLDSISFDSNILQEQRGIVKLDEMVKRLRNLHATVLEELTGIIRKRQMAEHQIIQDISEGKLFLSLCDTQYAETKRLTLEKSNYETNKQAMRAEMANAIADFKKEIMGELRDMSHSREEFEEFVLDTLEKQSKTVYLSTNDSLVNEFTSSKFASSKT